MREDLEGLTLMAPAWARTHRLRRRAVQNTSRVMVAVEEAAAGAVAAVVVVVGEVRV